MKKILVIFAAILLFVACSSPADDCIKILEEGRIKAEKASTTQELSDITIEVKEKLTILGNQPGGDEKMSIEDTRRVLEVRERFYKAVEQRAAELSHK